MINACQKIVMDRHRNIPPWANTHPVNDAERDIASLEPKVPEIFERVCRALMRSKKISFVDIETRKNLQQSSSLTPDLEGTKIYTQVSPENITEVERDPDVTRDFAENVKALERVGILHYRHLADTRLETDRGPASF